MMVNIFFEYYQRLSLLRGQWQKPEIRGSTPIHPVFLKNTLLQIT